MANEKGSLELVLLDVTDNPVVDSGIGIKFFELPGGGSLGAVNNQSLPQSYKLPAFPDAKFVRAEITPSRYRAANSPFVSLTASKTTTCEMRVMRRPDKWTADFTAWAQLPGNFQALKDVLTVSPKVQVKENGATLGAFTGAAYDNISDKKSVLAKACLLNLYAKLTTLKEPGGASWFSFVQEMLIIGQERFIAVVKPEMGEIVRLIKQNLAHFPDYKDTPAQNHFGNFPAACQINKNKMFSLKSEEDHANIQLTFAPGKHPATGADALLLDADIDENGKLLAHLADLFKHKINGGTHPFDIHEYLKDSQTTHHAQSLGYKLV